MECYSKAHVVVKNESGGSIDVYVDGRKAFFLSKGKEQKYYLDNEKTTFKVNGYKDQVVQKRYCKSNKKYIGYNLKYKKAGEIKFVPRGKDVPWYEKELF